MTVARRLLALLGGTLGALALLVPVASAHQVSGGWTSPAPDALPSVEQPRLAGTITHDEPVRPIRQVTFKVKRETEQPEGCPKPPELPAWPGGDRTTVSWAFEPPAPPDAEPVPGQAHHSGFVCNGTYRLDATAQLTGLPGHEAMAPVSTLLKVAIPSGPPSGITAMLDRVGDERVVALNWQGPQDLYADLVGFVVERRIDGGAWEQVAATGATEPRWTDSAAAGADGTFVYRVAAVRLGASGGSDDLVVSAPSEEHALVVPRSATPTTADRGGSGGGKGGGSTATTTPRAVVSHGPVVAELQRQAANVQGSSIQSSPPTTTDTGFKPELDYGGRRRQVNRAPDGGLFGGVLGETSGERKDVLTPVAAGLVLLMWFVHIRMLLRRAAAPVLQQT